MGAEEIKDCELGSGKGSQIILRIYSGISGLTDLFFFSETEFQRGLAVNKSRLYLVLEMCGEERVIQNGAQKRVGRGWEKWGSRQGRRND